jgi:hypothetical protein
MVTKSMHVGFQRINRSLGASDSDSHEQKSSEASEETQREATT